MRTPKDTCLLAAITQPVALAVLAMLIVAPLTATAHKGATGIVKQRMDAMKVMRTNLRAVTAMFKGKRVYDAAQLKRAATIIEKHALDMPNLFPKGSAQHPSEAHPDIWAHWPDFKRSANELASYAEALAKSADSPKTSLAKEIFANIGKTCSRCHKRFKERKR